MTKNELIYNVKEKLKLDSDDEKTSDEYIAHLIDIKRVKVLKQRLDKTPWRAPIEYKQELCLDLEVVDSVDGHACFGGILRTKNPLPNLIRFRGGNSGITVRRPDRTALLVDLVDLSRLPFLGNNRFASQIVYAAFDYDNRLYLISSQKKHLLMEAVQVGGIYEDVELAGALECEIDTTCEPWDRNYPLDVSMIDDVVAMVVQDLGRRMQAPEDEINDSRDKKTKN